MSRDEGKQRRILSKAIQAQSAETNHRSTVYVEGNAVMSTVPDQANEGKSRSFLNIYQSEPSRQSQRDHVVDANQLYLAANFEVLRRTQDAEGSD